MGKERNLPKNPSDSLDDFNSDVNIFSFIVRVWKETPSSEVDQDLWRGHITPIPEGNRHYFTDIDEIPAFMQDYFRSLK
jgi:hypothetical protein